MDGTVANFCLITHTQVAKNHSGTAYFWLAELARGSSLDSFLHAAFCLWRTPHAVSRVTFLIKRIGY